MTAQTIDREITDAAEIEGYIEITDEQAEDVGYLKAARSNTRGWETRRDELTAKVKGVLGDAKGAIHKGRVVAEVTERGGRRTVDLDALKARFPDAYAACVTEGKTQRVLNIK